MNTTAVIKDSSINVNAPLATSTFSRILIDYLHTYYRNPERDLIIMCIGTDRSTGDSLGPLIGYKLDKSLRRYNNVFIHGTLEDPVHAKNLKDSIDYVYNTYQDPFVIAIDACLGKLERIGYVTVGHGPLKPGAGVNKELPPVGDLHITGIVNLGGFMEYIILQNTRLNLVMKMADTVSEAFQYALWKFSKNTEKEQSGFH
ncbi:spore protease YyaC [Geosporobacter ferrireducens]|uniref:Spore protease YyaC n=1 Tax=Geosporobacter ferrireducens TaxID=1424294 RepID=A0A1D8GHX0_9FIRM|nr:spore protease YyaC [Geosporobacter ferrireducens]AOT70480.1 spore protease YyaC [Geosporobacter ferrireducens]MTI57172.1 spore protease YyaC [Geosporobacter ferrireducens]